ncbi:MAG: class I SAM-dependent methyltransferase [Chitinophagales bacterium]|nr:class I SAM-dependent methyltransferase [Chitinophagales bacterium]
MSLISIDTIKSFNELNKRLWQYCWKYWYSKEYIHGGIKEYLNQEFIKIKSQKGQLTILDIGCGSAWVAKYFSKLYDKYTGIDFNEELIEQLKKDFADNSQCSFYTHDIESTESHLFQKDTYNLVLASFILLELSDLKTFFKNAASVQLKGDYLIITGLDPVNEILRISNSSNELEENLNLYRHSDSPLVLTKEMSFNGDDTKFEYLRVLYSIRDILNVAFDSYELFDLDDKYNLHADSSKSPLYYIIKLRRK